MRTTHQSPPLTPKRDARHPARAPESAPSSSTPPATRQTASVTLAMRLLHRTAASPNAFMSADERAYLEHRLHGAE